MTDLTSRTVVVKDLLIVSIGDSAASGEGNPDKAQQMHWSGLWVNAGPVWKDERCHRSVNEGPAQAALEIEIKPSYISDISILCMLWC